MDVRPSRLRSHRAWPAVIVAALVLTGLVAPTGVSRTTGAAGAARCPAGYVSYADYKATEARALGGSRGAALAALAETVGAGVCINTKHPESPAELAQPFIDSSNQLLAPAGALKPGALKSAVAERDALKARGVPVKSWGNGWQQYGVGPLHTDDGDYGVSSLGTGKVAGRTMDLEWVPERKALYAAKPHGGVWKSTDKGAHWKSVGDSLPTQVIGSIAWTPANGGTLIALSGDQSFGRYSYEGFGAFYSTNDGRTWKKARGVPDETMGFRAVVDPTNPREVYAATGAGLYRSTDGGRSYVNVRLPVGNCAGKSNRAKGCLLANIVTDAVVQHPGGINEVGGGVVVAAVGWRGSNHANPDGTIQSPNNGIYISETGAPGSFVKSEAPGFAEQARIGRTELGAAYGPDQDHNYLYAIVQDAVNFNENPVPTIDLPEGSPVGSTPAYPTALNGIYSSSDFGETWQLMASGAELQSPHTSSALTVTTFALAGFGPGIQAWFNMFIQPDPTAADPALGIPTRLLFGLEEVWQNELPVPQSGKSSFKVIGRYFSGDTCLFLDPGSLVGGLPVPICPTDRDDPIESTTTTHPDQHMAAFIPEAGGGVTLVVANDGGVYKQEANPGQEFTQTRWGSGSNMGFHTLMPYHAVMARDGTVWMGLQDNGTAKIEPKDQRQVMTLGGDGFFVAVNPDDPKIAFGEYTYADMSATTDGGESWSAMTPPVTNAQFSNPFVMDPLNPDHLVTAGRQVVETLSGAGTGSSDWKKVFDLGTQDHPGDPAAEATDDYGEDPSNSMTAIDAVGSNVYVGFCSACDVLNALSPFKNGLATNVGGTKTPKAGTPRGWHFAPARGLPNRYITDVSIDPANPRTVYVTLGGYSRRWTPPGTLDRPSRVGKGHVYVSTNAGQTFRDISGNLPDARATWLEVKDDELIVASDVGVFIKKKAGKTWSFLGKGLPNVPVHTVELSGRDKNLLVAATHGRGVYVYRFGPPRPYGPVKKGFPKPGKIKNVVMAGPFGFETGEEGWTIETVGNSGWRRQPPGNASSNSMAVMPYTDEMSTILTSPEMKHPGGTVEVSWAELRDLEDGFDYLTIDWSNDGKKWYSAGAITGQNADFPNFSQNAMKLWAPKGSLYVRFRVTSDQLVSFPANQGLAIDDITVKY
jgi:hypothetical protein